MGVALMNIFMPPDYALCSDCNKTPILMRIDDELLYYPEIVEIENDSGDTLKIPFNIQRIDLKHLTPDYLAAIAVVSLNCPDCKKLHEIKYYLKAIRIYISNLGSCLKCNSKLDISNESISFQDFEGDSAKLEIKCIMQCKLCCAKTTIDNVSNYFALDNIFAFGSIDIDLLTAYVKPTTYYKIEHRFKAALSFPGKYRPFVKNIAEQLDKELGMGTVFYDEYFEAELSRPNADIYLQHIYHEKSDLIVVFICSEYTQSKWCGLEWRAIRNLINSREKDVMLLRFDQVIPQGLFNYTDIFVDIKERSHNEIADMIKRRLMIY